MATPALQDELLAVAQNAAAQAVELIHENRPSQLVRQTKSSTTDEVTQMDRASETLIRAIIERARPADSVIGEEGDPLEGTTDVTWWIDPIDGTTNYVYDYPGYAVSIAAQVGDEMYAGVVADPTHRRTYSAALARGSYCNGEPIHLPAETPELPKTLVATGFGYDPLDRAAQGEAVGKLLPQIRDIRRLGAAAPDLCLVASGRVDAYYERGLAMWDLAAGLLIASEAGAASGAIDGGPAKPDSVLVAHPTRFEELQILLNDVGA